MKVLKRTQITEISVTRVVSHNLEVNSQTYTRNETVKTHTPYMDCEVSVSEPQVKWSIYIGDRTVAELSKREVKALQLEEKFASLDINDRNGNGK